MVLGRLTVPGRLTYLIRVMQGPTALAVSAGGVVWTFFLSSIIFHFFLPLSGRRPDKTAMLSQRAVKPKTTNQPNISANRGVTVKG